MSERECRTEELSDLIENRTYLRARKAAGEWSLSDSLGVRQLFVRFTVADGQRQSLGNRLFVIPYHSSPQYIHFCRATNGIGGRVYVFKLAPAEGQPPPSPPK